jgi:hypothetical protein
MRSTILLAFAALSLQGAVRPLPGRTRCRQTAAAQPWGKSLRQIPSTVIDVGVLRHVPYTSYRSGEYELNVYGDPAQPACFEAGIHGALLRKPEARRHCLALVTALLDDAEDRKLLASLHLEVDKKSRNGLTFEITPPTAPDAYGGWWVSVYDEKALDRARATPEELRAITTTREEVKKLPAPESKGLAVEPLAAGRWGAEDLSQARTRKDVAEAKQAVYSPTFTRKNGAYVPDRTIDDTGWILFICANSDRHEDREVILKTCPACSKESTFFWDTKPSCFICFQCGAAYDNALVKCPDCAKVPRRVRTKHR